MDIDACSVLDDFGYCVIGLSNIRDFCELLLSHFDCNHPSLEIALSAYHSFQCLIDIIFKLSINVLNNMRDVDDKMRTLFDSH